MHTIKKGAKLTEDQKKQLKEIAPKHGKKHLASMRMSMLKGMSFKEAHEAANKKGYK